MTLHDGTFGGSWSSSPVSVATIGSSSGTVGGISAGTATVTYTLATGCDVFYTMTVDPLPASVITPLGDTMICPGGYVDLTANTGDSLTYQWYDGGPIAGAVASSYVATAAGVYEVRVRNGLGCTLLSAPVSVTINGDTAYISAAGNTTCSGSPLTLYANAGAGLSYQWQLNGSSITGAVGSTYNVTDSSGNYTVVVTNSTGCLAVSAAYSVTVNPVPVPTVTASGALTFCAGGSVTFTADTTGGSGYSYQWYSAPGGLISGADSNSFTTSATGSYWVEETNSDGCNGATIPANVIVVSLPDASITPSGPLTFCSGGNVILTAGSAGDSYQWYNDGVAIPGATNQSYTDTASGNFTVFVTGGAPTGCTSLTSAATTVLVVSTPEVIPLTSTTFCWGGGVTLTVNVVSATAGLTYRWYYDGSPIPGATSAVYTTSVPGLYSCLISDGSCNAATSTVPVTENPLPNPVVTFDGNTLHAQNYYVSYQWYENTTAVAGATDSTDIPSTDGNYAVAVTDTNGCQSVSDVYVLTAVLGAGNVAAMSEIKIYPNPAQTELHISAPYSVRVEISSIDGRQMLSREQAKDIDISGLANGIYMVMLYDGNGQLVKAEKLVKDGN